MIQNQQIQNTIINLGKPVQSNVQATKDRGFKDILDTRLGEMRKTKNVKAAERSEASEAGDFATEAAALQIMQNPEAVAAQDNPTPTRQEAGEGGSDSDTTAAAAGVIRQTVAHDDAPMILSQVSDTAISESVTLHAADDETLLQRTAQADTAGTVNAEATPTEQTERRLPSSEAADIPVTRETPPEQSASTQAAAPAAVPQDSPVARQKMRLSPEQEQLMKENASSAAPRILRPVPMTAAPTDQVREMQDSEDPDTIPMAAIVPREEEEFADLITKAARQLSEIRTTREEPEADDSEGEITVVKPQIPAAGSEKAKETPLPRQTEQKTERISDTKSAETTAILGQPVPAGERTMQLPQAPEAQPGPVHVPEQAEQIQVEVIRNLENQKMEFRMQLHPEHLGRVDVKMALEGGKLVVQMVSSTMTNELLSRQAESLATSLRAASPELTTVQVVTESSQTGQGFLDNAFQNMNGSAGQQQGDGRNTARAGGPDILLQPEGMEDGDPLPDSERLMSYSI